MSDAERGRLFKLLLDRADGNLASMTSEQLRAYARDIESVLARNWRPASAVELDSTDMRRIKVLQELFRRRVETVRELEARSHCAPMAETE